MTEFEEEVLDRLDRIVKALEGPPPFVVTNTVPGEAKVTDFAKAKEMIERMKTELTAVVNEGAR